MMETHIICDPQLVKILRAPTCFVTILDSIIIALSFCTAINRKPCHHLRKRQLDSVCRYQAEIHSGAGAGAL